MVSYMVILPSCHKVFENATVLLNGHMAHMRSACRSQVYVAFDYWQQMSSHANENLRKLARCAIFCQFKFWHWHWYNSMSDVYNLTEWLITIHCLHCIFYVHSIRACTKFKEPSLLVSICHRIKLTSSFVSFDMMKCIVFRDRRMLTFFRILFVVR